jgi:hypothetical protein
MYWPDGHFDVLPTPIIVQEIPKYVNGSNMEGGHSNVDAITHIHRGGGYYGAIDGSVQFVNESPSNASGQTGAWVWQSTAPSGQVSSMAINSGTWGYWDHQ